MTTDPRAALDRLVAALESHLVASQQRRGDADPAVVQAYDTLADAFDTYDEALFDAYGETTPFELPEDEDDDNDGDDDDSDDDEDFDEDDLDDDFDDSIDEDFDESAAEQTSAR